MKKIGVIIFFIVGTILFVPTGAHAGTLTNVSISALDPSPNATTTYTFSFTTESFVPATPYMILQLNLPSGFNLSNVDPSAVSVTLDGVPVSVDTTPGYVGTYLIAPSTIGVRLNIGVADGSNVVVSVDGIVNPSSPGSYTFGFFRSATGGGNEIDAPASLPSITIQNVYNFAGGNGATSTPYQIETCEQLQQIGADESLLSLHYVLKNDINCGPGGPIGNNTHIWNAEVDQWEDGVVGGILIPDEYNANYPNRVSDVVNNGYQGFLPIGNGGAQFTGTLDGQGYSIDNIWIFRKLTGLVGIFGFADGAIFSNIVISNANIVGASYTGGLVGVAQGTTTINNVRVMDSTVRAYLAENGGGIAGSLSDGTITNSEVQGGAVHGSGVIIGGLVGSAYSSTIQNATSSAAVDGGHSVGGAVGKMENSHLLNVQATGRVIGTLAEPIKDGVSIGGLVGRASYNSTIASSSASGYVTSEGNIVGGLVGYIEQTSISESYATGNVGGLGDYTGGLVGFSLSSSIQKSFARGDVSGINYVGGFVGNNGGSSSIIEDSYATGNVAGSENYIGGFVGASSGQIARSYSTGNVTGTGSGGFVNVGGFVGYNMDGDGSTVINSSFSVGNVSTDPSYSNVGSFVGLNNDTITNSIFKASPLPGIGGGTNTGVTDVSDVNTLKSNSNLTVFESWNFNTNWSRICNQYPGLRWYSGASVLCDVVTPVTTNNNERSSGSRSSIRPSNTSNFNTSVSTNTSSSGATTGTIAITSGATTTACTNKLYPTKVIKIGAQNDPEQVKLLEQYLNAFENANLPVNGIYSEGDRAAVVKWQEKYAADILTPWGITKGTGFVFKTSLDKFKNLFAEKCDNVLKSVSPVSTPSVTIPTETVGLATSTPVRDLKNGMSGNDVRALQQALISKNAGSAARALAKSGISGYFGKLTQAALIEFQKSVGITPASGYFGSKTKAYLPIVTN